MNGDNEDFFELDIVNQGSQSVDFKNKNKKGLKSDEMLSKRGLKNFKKDRSSSQPPLQNMNEIQASNDVLTINN